MRTETMLAIAFIFLLLAATAFGVASIFVQPSFGFGALAATLLAAAVIDARSGLR